MRTKAGRPVSVPWSRPPPGGQLAQSSSSSSSSFFHWPPSEEARGPGSSSQAARGVEAGPPRRGARTRPWQESEECLAELARPGPGSAVAAAPGKQGRPRGQASSGQGGGCAALPIADLGLSCLLGAPDEAGSYLPAPCSDALPVYEGKGGRPATAPEVAARPARRPSLSPAGAAARAGRSAGISPRRRRPWRFLLIDHSSKQTGGAAPPKGGGLSTAPMRATQGNRPGPQLGAGPRNSQPLPTPTPKSHGDTRGNWSLTSSPLVPLNPPPPDFGSQPAVDEEA